MPDDATMIESLHTWTDAFNRGDLETFWTYMADKVTAIVNDTSVATTKAEFRSVIDAARARGWTGQRIISATARANVLSFHYFNTFADGSTTTGAGLVLIGDDGKATAVRTLNAQGSAIQPAERGYRPDL